MLPIKLIVVEGGPRTDGTSSFFPFSEGFRGLEVRGKVRSESLGFLQGSRGEGLGKGLKLSRAERSRIRTLSDQIPVFVHYLVSLPLGVRVVRRLPFSMPRK